jgi:two-component system cell cycle sensor histidine kinase/response regulator CckA
MRNSIRTRLIVAFIGLAIVPLLLVGVILAWQGFTTEERQALNLQREVARRVATEVTAFFEALENELRLVSKAQVWPGLDWNEQHSILKLLMSQAVFEELVLLDSQGQEQIHLSRLGHSSTDQGHHPEADEFVIPQTTGEVYYSPVRFEETTGEPLMTIAVPLLDASTGLADGVLISEVRLKKIWNLIAGVQVSPGQSVYIVDAQDRVVAHRNPSVVLRGTSFDVPQQDGIQPGLTGSSVVLAVDTVRFGQQEFNVVAEQAVSEAMALALNTVLITATLIVAALVTSSTLGFLIVRQIVRPIESLTTTARAISAGDLSQQVAVTSRDEVGQLAAAFNRMTAQLRDLFDSLEQRIAERKRIEEALRESEERHRKLFEEARDGIFLADAETGIIVDCNRAAAELVGRDRSDLIGQHQRILHPSRRIQDGFSVTFKKHIEESERQVLEEQIITRTGEIKEVAIKANLVHIGGRRLLQGVFRDVTERKRAAEALQESEEKFRTFTESAPVAIMIYQNYQCVYANPAAETITGCTNEELLSMKFWDVAHPDYKDVIEEWGKAIARDESVPKQYELRIVAKDGSEKWIDGRLELTEYEGKRAALISAIDITDRKQVEEEREQLLAQIREQAQQVQQIMDTVPEGVLLLDADRRVVLANPVAQGDIAVLADAAVGDTLTRLGGRPLEELLTSPPKGLWHEVESDDRIFEVIARPVEPALSLPKGNGSEPENWVLVINDVTQEREVEQRVQQQERLAAVGQLAAGIAHDFNNLLTTIMLYAQMGLRKPDLPPGPARSFKTIIDESQQAAQLVQQILDFSRRSMMEIRPVDLASSIEKTIDILQRTLPDNIRLITELEAGKCVVHADPTRMQQVLMNLATNARDAMPKGGELRISLSKVEVRADEEPPDFGELSQAVAEMACGEWVCLAVSDTGTGMPEEVQSHLFEPFFTTKPAGLGTGLGMAQVYGIVTQHEGAIGVETEVGRGTTVRVCLPIRRAEGVEKIAREASVLLEGKGEIILFVEDEEKLLEAGREMLESLGYRVLAAVDGREALGVYESAGKVDLLLTDVVMPEMGGKELIRALRKADPDLKAVAITGHLLAEDLEDLKEAGIMDVVYKPFDVSALAQMVRNALDAD